MSLDLYERETSDRLSRLAPVQRPEAGVFDGFSRGTAMSAMQTFAKAGRSASMALAAPIALVEKAGEFGPWGRVATTLSDRFFRAHDELFQSAVDTWTPTPGEVGEAGQIVGQLVATIPMVIANPLATVAATELGVAEDLSRKGVGTAQAVAVGGVQAAGLGLGVWMPILGQNLWQRVVVGGAGFNAVQGIATRAASGAILEGTAAAEDFKAFDGAALTLDVLLGAAFGGLTHLSPAQRAQGKAAWDRIEEWASTLRPSDVDAIAALRQAQHLNVDSTPGRPVAAPDIDAHVTRLRTAIDQLARNEPVNVSDLPAARVEADPVRQAESEARARDLVGEAEAVRVEEGITLYHGSPHEFDRFDMGRIGTGEGAQAFGHGLYFAENPDVAGSYQRGANPYIDPATFARVQDAFLLAKEEGLTGQDAVIRGKNIINQEAMATNNPYERRMLHDAMNNFEAFTTKRPGGLYKVEIPKGATERMIDWDKPLREQPQTVKDLANKLFGPRLETRDVGGGLVDVREKGGGSIGTFPSEKVADVLRNPVDHYPFTGQQFYKQFAQSIVPEGAALSDWGGAVAKASQRLNELGVPGIRYLDQGSRSKKSGTSNFVLFDDSLARIVDRNGIPVQGLSSPPLDVPALQTRLTKGHPDVEMRLHEHENGTLELDLIEVKDEAKAGQGLGPKAMRDLTAEADKHGRGILLLASPLRPDRMPLAKLEKWYEGFGFEKQETEFSNATYMYREPRGAASADGSTGASRGVEEGSKENLARQGETEEVTPLALESGRIAVERPDLTITVGQDADGKPIRQKVSDYLAEVREQTARAQEDVKLFEVAAACMMGVA